jgi:hypothetical protein
MRAVSISEAAAPDVTIDVTDPAPVRVPDRVVEQVRPQAETDREAVAETAPATAARTETRTAAERLAPRVVDRRLWRPVVVLPREPTLSDVQDRIELAIEMLSDSALAEAERAMRARDWTVEDASGGRWGISPGALHLGSVTLPLPIFFPADMEQEARNAYWREVEHQMDRAEFLQSFDARVKAIRERRDRERAERRPDGGG